MADLCMLSKFNAVQLFFTWFSLANMWLTFSIIVDLLPTQGIVIGGNIVVVSNVQASVSNVDWSRQIHWINQALKWIYMIFLALQASTITAKFDAQPTLSFHQVRISFRKQTEKRTTGIYHYHVVCPVFLIAIIVPTSL
jgi:hypothetical protein